MSKYLVYTCVTNNYDRIRKILAPQDSNIDFICFTDSINKTIDMRKDTGWIFMPIPVELRELDKKRQARLVKIGIYKYLKGYSGYLWIDAPIIIIGNIGNFIKEHPFSDNRNIYVSKHYMRDCVYQEFAQVLRLNKDRSAYVYNQYERYKKQGYPVHNGMAETSILYRNFNDLNVQTHASYWMEEIINYSYRDQLSFNWAAWTTHTPITYLTEDIYKRDVENETSNYFFLPWPKHNNPNVVEQLKARLSKGLVNNQLNIINELKTPPPQQQKTQLREMDQFEEEYQKFIEELKKKSQKKEIEKIKLNEELDLSKLILPVVITTHNRTQVAATVIESLIKNLKFDGKIEYCIADDRSKPSHIEELLKVFKEYGIKPTVKKANSRYYGLGASLNRGLKWAFKLSDFVLTTEDDWLLVKPLDMNDKVKTILENNIAGIRLATTSAPNSLKNTNIENYLYIIKDSLKQYIFNNQVMLRHKRIFDKIGLMKENCSPAEQEKDIVTKYNKFSNFGEIMPVLYPKEMDEFPALYGEHNYFHHIGISTDPNKIRPIKEEHKLLNQ